MSNQQQIKIPVTFYCPITHMIMEDPVIDPEGNSYERSAIEQWLKNNRTSPITRSPLSISQLRTNRALRDSIELIQSQIKNKEILKKKFDPIKDDPEEVEENVDMKTHISILSQDEKVLISVIPPEGKNRSPCDIVCVVDTSGSMETEAKMKNQDGKTERYGLSYLDVVKHAVKTIIQTLGTHDRFALISFSTQAKVEYAMKRMTDQEKRNVTRILERLKPDGQTNLWDGLSSAMNLLRARQSQKKVGSVLLLTDGVPNISPPRGEVAMLKRYKKKHKNLSCSINTFGFCYELDSQLLNELAVEGNGLYSFIPDSSFVGTVFVNSMSNLLVTHATEVMLTLKVQNGSKINEVCGNYLYEEIDDNSIIMKLGSLMYGNTKDIVLKMKLPNDKNVPYIKATLTYNHRCSKDVLKVSVNGSLRVLNEKKVMMNYYRLKFNTLVSDIMEMMIDEEIKEAQTALKALITEVKKSNVKKEKYVIDLLKDMRGEVKKAIANMKDYEKWGKHYLLSLSSAHLLQRCNNFKDPGVAHYGKGKLFCKIRDIADDIFVNLPPPTPTKKFESNNTNTITSSNTSLSRSGRGGGGGGSRLSSMSVFYQSSNPCFDGNCDVQMGSGILKKVKDVKKNDTIQSTNGMKSKVVCVIKTHCEQSKCPLVKIGNLLVTQWHPIRINGTWTFPSTLANPEVLHCPAVYSFVLESSHVMIINDIECCTLGHGFTDNNVIRHEYFGSSKVINDLRGMKGWGKGLVELRTGCLVRKYSNERVVGLRNNFIEG